jgi:RHO1 GDP-GTP exchange protein 1/2
LLDRDEEWHKLVPSGSQEALGDREVQRQSVLFEVFKSERDYVHDMELVEEVNLRSAADEYLTQLVWDRFS